MKEQFKFEQNYIDFSNWNRCELYQSLGNTEERGLVFIENYTFYDLHISVISKNMLKLGWNFTYAIHQGRNLVLLSRDESEVREFLDMYKTYLDPFKF